MNEHIRQKLEESLVAICTEETISFKDTDPTSPNTSEIVITEYLAEFSNSVQVYCCDNLFLVYKTGHSKINIFTRADLEEDRIKNLSFGEETQQTINILGLATIAGYTNFAIEEIDSLNMLLTVPIKTSSLSYSLDTSTIDYRVSSVAALSLTFIFHMGAKVDKFEDTTVILTMNFIQVGSISVGDSNVKTVLALLFRKLYKEFAQPIVQQCESLAKKDSASE